MVEFDLPEAMLAALLASEFVVVTAVVALTDATAAWFRAILNAYLVACALAVIGMGLVILPARIRHALE